MTHAIPHHLTVGADPWCSWTGCAAGQSVNAAVGGVTCAQPSKAAATRAAKLLAPHYRAGSVKIVAGPCQHAPA